jgi:hypothetical protein
MVNHNFVSCPFQYHYGIPPSPYVYGPGQGMGGFPPMRRAGSINAKIMSQVKQTSFGPQPPKIRNKQTPKTSLKQLIRMFKSKYKKQCCASL